MSDIDNDMYSKLKEHLVIHNILKDINFHIDQIFYSYSLSINKFDLNFHGIMYNHYQYRKCNIYMKYDKACNKV